MNAKERRRRAHEAVVALARSPLKADEVASVVELLWREETIRQGRSGMEGIQRIAMRESARRANEG